MSTGKPQETVLDLLRDLARADASEGPSPGVERRLAEEFLRPRRETPASPAATVSANRWWRRPAIGGWLAAAATVALVAGFGIAWRVAPAGRGGPRPAELVGRGLVSTTLSAPSVGVPVREIEPGGGQPSAASRRVAGPRQDAVVFVAWPGAEVLPPLESGQVVRMELPASVVPLLGLAHPRGVTARMVPAELIIGQDGRPRAVRLMR